MSTKYIYKFSKTVIQLRILLAYHIENHLKTI